MEKIISSSQSEIDTPPQSEVVTPPQSDEDYLCIVAGYYLSIGFTQKEIAQILNKSEPQISRMIVHAKENKWLKTTHTLYTDVNKDEKVLPFLRIPEKETEILKKYPSLQRARVYPANDKVFFESSARRLGEIILQDISKQYQHIILVSWGSTLNNIIEQLHIKKQNKSSKNGIRIYSAIGNFSVESETLPVYEKSVKESANTNARNLCKKFNIIRSRPLMTVAILSNTTPDDIKYASCVFLNDYGLMEVYGAFWEKDYKKSWNENDDRIAWKANTLISSIGGADIGYLKLNGITDNQYKKIAGNIMGIVFDNQAQEVVIKNRQVLGPSMELIHEIARQHREKSASGGLKPVGSGVVIFAKDGKKAPPINILASHGFINELVLNEHCAEALLKLH